MDLRPELQIAVMIKAMDQVVLPAVDPANRPALEQAGLVRAMLALLRDRLPLAYRFDRDELERHLALATALLDILTPDHPHAEPIAAAAKMAGQALGQAALDPACLLDCTTTLRHAITALARATDDQTIRQLILDAAKIQLDLERAWLMPIGFDPPDSGIPPIETQLPRFDLAT